jgi:hypothetical protein
MKKILKIILIVNQKFIRFNQHDLDGLPEKTKKLKNQ